MKPTTSTDDLLAAMEWLEAESSASEGQSTPAIETIRQLIQQAINAASEPMGADREQ